MTDAVKQHKLLAMGQKTPQEKGSADASAFDLKDRGKHPVSSPSTSRKTPA